MKQLLSDGRPAPDVVPDDEQESAAERAKAEAAARHARRADRVSPPELAGRGGLDPVRFGDWEVKGLATDF